MRKRAISSVAFLMAVAACDRPSGEHIGTRDLPGCGRETSYGIAGGSMRSGWVDEGGGYISNTHAQWSDSLGGAGSDGPSARLFNCASGEGMRFGWSPRASVSAHDFIDRMRKAKKAGDPEAMASEGRRLGLTVRQTRANAESETAICGCELYYPQTERAWAPEASNLKS